MHPGAQYNLLVIEGKATYERIISSLRDVETNEAISHIKDFLKIYPEFAQAHNDLAVYYYKAGNSLKALAHYEKAHKLDPRNITFLKNLADFYMVELEWLDDSIHIYLDILKDNPFDVEVLNALGAISMQVGRKEQSKQYYNRAIQLDCNSKDARLGLHLLGVAPQQENGLALEQPVSAEPFIISGAVQQSFQPPQIISAQEPAKTPESRYQHAIEQAGKNRTDDAIHILEELVADAPDHALAHNDLAVLYQQTGNLELALKYQQLATSLEPSNPVFQKNLADLLFIGFSEYEKALTVYVNLLSKAPKDVEILKAIAHVCIELEQFDNARHFFEQILAVKPWDKEARAALVEIKDCKPSAVSPLLANASREEMYADVQELIKGEKFEEARLRLEQLVQLNDVFALAHNDLGVLRYQAGDIQGARSSYERAVDLEPSNASFRKNLADLYFVALGMTDEAIGIYLELLKEQPRNVETLESLGIISNALGQTTEARIFFRRALEIEPWNAGLRTALQGL